MSIVVTKTDYLLWRQCPKNVWYKFHRPEVWQTGELSEFEKAIIETGNEVELSARRRWPDGVLVEGRGEAAQKETRRLIEGNDPVLFQPVFLNSQFLAAVDVLERNSNGTWNLYEIKSTTEVDAKTHYHDAAFQAVLLEKAGLAVAKVHVVHLNSEYKKQGEINLAKLFAVTDITEEVGEIKDKVADEMQSALEYLSKTEEPKGYCDCVYKGRSNHCSTFSYSNPKVPHYGVHDLSRIGSSKTKLQELVDVGIFELNDIPRDFDLSLVQQNQVEAHVSGRTIINHASIIEELDGLAFPLYFLDYETFPAAIPRFDGFSSYQQIPFQYALYVLDSPDAKPRHHEFLFPDNRDPSIPFLESLKKDLGTAGSIIVWNKKFECNINEELAERNPEFNEFVKAINARVYDLMDIFAKQYYVHKGFLGKVSIKNVLPVLVPELSYKSLAIREGGSASQAWNTLTASQTSQAEKAQIIADLKEYCKLDAFAMYAIWQHLHQLGA